VNYRKLVEEIPAEKQEMILDKLVDVILASKNDEKILPQLANSILYHWQRGVLLSEYGLTALLEAAYLLEPDKTQEAFSNLQMANIAEQIKGAPAKT